jgi:hypothetical protein
MSEKKPDISTDIAISGIPDAFRKRLIQQYKEIKSLFKQGRFEFSGLKVGKFCETLLRFLQDKLTGTYTPFGNKLSNFIEECDKLSRTPKTAGHESLRILMPHALKFLYSVRSKRSIGHIGGDIDSNEMDGMVCAKLTDWIMGELIRIYHGLSIEDAIAIVHSLSTKEIPVVWEVAGKKRILNPALEYKEKVLVLLYSTPDFVVPVEDLFEWVEYSKANLFKTNILKPLHDKKFIEYDRDSGMVILSPKGVSEVEQKILI